MSWRTVIVSRRSKVDYKMGYLVIREGEETIRVFIEEINTLMLESTGISITGYLLSELTKRKILVIFCDEKRQPISQLLPLHGSHDCSLKLKKQLEWKEETKTKVWTKIVSKKIENQALYLKHHGFDNEYTMLKDYLDNLTLNDLSNREGHAAKVYFNCCFNKKYTREDDCALNAALDYGYTVILSVVNRDITGSGYLTQIGLAHSNMYNQFNFGCDLMEPLRFIIDKIVFTNDFKVFESEQKRILLSIFEKDYKIDNQRQNLVNASRIFCQSVFLALNENDENLIKFIDYEL